MTATAREKKRTICITCPECDSAPREIVEEHGAYSGRYWMLRPLCKECADGWTGDRCDKCGEPALDAATVGIDYCTECGEWPQGEGGGQ